jgi:prepilin-type N-terminal cleavage/methylation domain-containing protein
MIRHLRDTYARRRGEELSVESGFTLIELLIVIVVLGILAATVIFALSGVTSQSATAACNSDAKTYEVAVAAYENAQNNTTNAPPGSTSDLLSGGPYGQFLHAAANNTHYWVAVSGDTSKTVQHLGGSTVPTTPAGTVWVGTPGGKAQNYDTAGCTGIS